MPSRVPQYRPPGWQPAARSYERLGFRREDKAFYSSARWRKLRALVLAEQPLCADCAKVNRVTPATEVHHEKERKQFPELSLCRENLTGLCAECHNARRKARETR